MGIDVTGGSEPTFSRPSREWDDLAFGSEQMKRLREVFPPRPIPAVRHFEPAMNFDIIQLRIPRGAAMALKGVLGGRPRSENWSGVVYDALAKALEIPHSSHDLRGDDPLVDPAA